ncbi:MAG: hypothetical protein GXO50_04010 [Chlorobi bacterium]|nr:hypothetical protein [Chlorobiota bacterium]
MTTRILNIRIKQFIRAILQIGILRAIFLLILSVLILFYVFSNISENKNTEIIIGAYSLILLSIHVKRKDKTFLSIHSEKPRKIFFVEYFTLSVPLIILLVYFGQIIYAAMLTIFISIIPFIEINIKKTGLNTVFQKLIPDDNFEWKSGVRKNFFILVFIWFTGILTSFYVASVPVIIFIFGIIISGFYETPESLPVLSAKELNEKRFLIDKITNHIKLFSILIIPLIVLFIIFNPEYYYIPLIEYLIISCFLVYTILLKYAFYRPDKKSEAVRIFTMAGIAGIFIPVLTPLILLLAIKFMFSALSNLKLYLHDFN